MTTPTSAQPAEQIDVDAIVKNFTEHIKKKIDDGTLLPNVKSINKAIAGSHVPHAIRRETFKHVLTHALDHNMRAAANVKTTAFHNSAAEKRIHEKAKRQAAHKMQAAVGRLFADDAEMAQIAAENNVEQLNLTKKLIDEKIKLLPDLINQLKKIRDNDFITGVSGTGGLTFSFKEGTLVELGNQLKESKSHVDDLLKMYSDAKALSGTEKLTKYGEIQSKINASGDAIFYSIEQVAIQSANAVNDMHVAIVEAQLDAAAYGADSVKAIKDAKTVVDSGISITGTFLKTTNFTGPLIRLSQFLSSLGGKIAQEVAVKVEVEKLGKDRPLGMIFKDADDDPFGIASRLIDRQQEYAEIIINGIGASLSAGLILAPGVSDSVMGGFDIVASAAQGVLKTVLSDKLDQAKEAYKANHTDFKESDPNVAIPLYDDISNAYDKVSGDIVDKLTGEIKSEKVQGPIKTFLEGVGEKLGAGATTGLSTSIAGVAFSAGDLREGDSYSPDASFAFNPIALGPILSDLLVPPLTKAFLLIFKRCRPSQDFDGSKLSGMLREIQFTQVPLWALVGAAASKQEEPRSEPFEVGQPGFQGPDYEFKEEIPDIGFETPYGTVVELDKARSRLEGARQFFCAIQTRNEDKVWGFWDPWDEYWSPVKLDNSVYQKKDWSKVTLDTDAIIEGKTRTEGQWYKVHAGYHDEHAGAIMLCLFKPKTGKLLWAHDMATTSGGAGQRDFQVGNWVVDHGLTVEFTDALLSS